MSANKRCLPTISITDKTLCLHSNDYLNLSTHPALINASQVAAQKYGIGSTGSRLLSGNHSLITNLESTLANLLHTESCLVFNSGFQLNTGLLPSFYTKNDLILADKYIHASLIDGAQLSQATFKRYKHNDITHLKTLLNTHRSKHKRCIIVTESLFSMTGDSPDLAALQDLASHYDTELMIDEAHAFGVLGPQGKGLCAEAGITPTFLVGTFGKSCGSSGAFVATNKAHTQHIINHCRSFIYTTAPSLPTIAATQAALDLLPSLDNARQQLQALSMTFQTGLKNQSLSYLGHAHIIAALYPGNDTVMHQKSILESRNILASAIRHPTVPKGKECIRFSLTSKLSIEDINHVLASL